MPVTATIPIPEDYLETAATYPFLTELLSHPSNGYLYGCYGSGIAGKMVKVKNDNFADITTVDFASDGQHTGPIDMVYSATRDRYYVLFRNGDDNRCVISEVNPTTLARTDFFNFGDIQPGAGSITADATNLYVVTFPTTPSYLVIIPFSAPGSFAEPIPLTGFSQAHCIRQFGGKLYLQGMTPPASGWVMRLTTAGVVEQTADFTGEEGQFPVDDIGESADHIWIGNRDLSGIVRKYTKTDFANVELISTGQLSRCTCSKRLVGYVWTAFENGRAVRINPTSGDRRNYTLNEGQGYHSEFTGGNEFIYTFNLSNGKIARYHIPSSGLPKQFGGIGEDSSQAIGLDSNGNIVMAGYFQSSIDFSGGAQTPLIGHGIWDIFLAKFSPSGEHIWSKGYGGAGNERIVSMAIDPNDNSIYVGGDFTGTANFGGPDRTAIGPADAFVAKYNSEGDYLWDVVFGGDGSSKVNTIDIIGPAPYGIVATGFYQSTTPVDFIDGSRPSAGVDSFLFRVNSAGVKQWAKRFTNGGAADRGTGIVVDQVDSSIYMTGFAGGSINLGGTTIVNQGGFLGKFDSGGNHLQSRAVGTANTAPALMGLGTDRDPIVFGTFPFSTNLGNADLFGGGTELFFVKYQRLTLAWVVDKGTSGTNTSPRGIKIDSNGNIYIAGFFKGTCNFGIQSLTSAFFGGFIAKYNSSFVNQWARDFKGTVQTGSDDSMNAVTVDSESPIVVGGFGAKATFDGRTFDSVGSTDILLARTSLT